MTSLAVASTRQLIDPGQDENHPLLAPFVELAAEIG